MRISLLEIVVCKEPESTFLVRVHEKSKTISCSTERRILRVDIYTVQSPHSDSHGNSLVRRRENNEWKDCASCVCVAPTVNNDTWTSNSFWLKSRKATPAINYCTRCVKIHLKSVCTLIVCVCVHNTLDRSHSFTHSCRV